VIAVAVVSRGVTPELTLMFGVTVPLIINLPAPLVAVPTAKCVIVDVDPVHAAKSMLATGLTLLLVTVNPAVERATVVRT
jgi:hypothetical protein